MLGFAGSRGRLTAVLLALLLSVTCLYYLEWKSDAAFESISQAADKTSHYLKDIKDSSSIFGTARDPPPTQPPYGAVVAAAREDEDLSWMNDDLFQKNWDAFPYNINKTSNPDPRLQTPMNKGHEAMVYLSYIIDNYDSLSWSTFFTHGHFEAWHQEQPIPRLINTLNRNALAKEGYISLRCDWYPTCPAEIRPWDHDATVWGPGIKRKETENAIAGNWRQIFPGEGMPDTISSQCCAQFAATRQAIRRRPRSDYERMRDWLIASLLEDEVSGRVFEKLWAYIFTGQAVHCPAPQQCACEYFGRCEEQDWAQPPEGLPALPTWP